MLGGFREAHAQSPQVRARVEAAREYLEANMTKDLDMASVARAAALSPYYLTRILKAQFGCPHTAT